MKRWQEWIASVLLASLFSALIAGFFSWIVLDERVAALVQVGLGFGGTWNGTLDEWLQVAFTMFGVLTFALTFVFAYAYWADEKGEEKK